MPDLVETFEVEEKKDEKKEEAKDDEKKDEEKKEGAIDDLN